MVWTKYLPRIAILISFLFFGICSFLIWQRYNASSLVFNNYHPQASVSSSTHQPTLIIIPSLSLSLPLYSATISNNVWPTTTTGVSYLSSSPIPGTAGNSILYGHNWESLLGRLPQLKKEQIITITFSDRRKENFRVIQTQIVSPTQTSVLANSRDSRITIYTCTGLFDTKRFVVTALHIPAV